MGKPARTQVSCDLGSLTSSAVPHLSLVVCQTELTQFLSKAPIAEAEPPGRQQTVGAPRDGGYRAAVWLWGCLLRNGFILEDKPDPRKQIYEPFLNTNGNRGEIINNQPQLVICNRNECFLVNNLFFPPFLAPPMV